MDYSRKLESNILPTKSKCMLPRVLIVEDEKLISWALSNTLKKSGFETTVVDSGEKAIDQLTIEIFDLIITDIKLPHIDGFQVASTVKAITPSTPVIMISASKNQNIEEAVNGSDIDYFIEKPFDLKKILELVEKFVTKTSISHI